MTESSKIGRATNDTPKSFWDLRPESDKLINLDFLRFVAASGIVVCHSAEFMVPRQYRAMSHQQTAGLTTFVDVFFLISGFVISYVYADKIKTTFQYADFLLRRLSRLLPLHIATLVFATAIFVTAMIFGNTVNNDSGISAKCITSAAFLIHAWNSCGPTVPNSVSWSISAELAAYILFPFIYVLFNISRLIRFVVFITVTLYLTWLSGSFDILTSSFTVYRAIPPFMIGMIAYHERGSIRISAMAAHLPIIVVTALIFGSFVMWPRIILILLAYALAFISISLDVNGITSKFSRKFAKFGQLTYSIYMLHLLVLLIFANAIADKILKFDLPGMIAATIASWIILLFISFVSFKYFETPARKYINHLFKFRS